MVFWASKVAIGSVLALVCSNLAAQMRATTADAMKATGASADLETQSKAATQTPKTSPATAQILASYEGQNVSSIQIAGRPDITTTQLEPLFVQKVGQPFSREKIEQTVSAIKAHGQFKEIQLQVNPDALGVKILLILEPAIYFGIFEFPGAEQFAYSRLVQVANFPSSAPFNGDDVELDRQSLIRFCQQEGYFAADVRPEMKVDADHGLADVIFRTTLSRRAKFGLIYIADATPEEAARLTKSLQTFLARARGAALRPGKTYQRASINKAASYLQSELAKTGRLDARIELQGAEYHADTNRADIHFGVQPGPLVKVDVEGAHLWSWTRKSLLPVYQGIGVDDESVEEGRQAILSYFQAKGYFDAKVAAEVKNDGTSQTIVYQITKDKKHKVNAVQVVGNTTLATNDLLQHVTVQKSHIFSPGYYSDKLVRDSAKNLIAVYESEGFSSVKVIPKVDRDAGNIRASFQVIEGPRDIVSSLRIEGADTFPEQNFAPLPLKLAEGQPYSQKFVQADRASITANYLKAGYLTASFRQTASVVSKADSHRINVVYHIYEGPQVHSGRVVTLGRVRTKQRLINEDVSSIVPEQPLTETELLTAESRLYDHTGVFDWAEVDPKRQITTQTTEDILVKVHEAKKNEMTYGVGFEVVNRGGSVPSGTVALPNLPPVGLPSSFTTSQTTFYGPRGTFQYTRNNVRGKGESISFTGFAGRLDQKVAAFYIDPNFRWSLWKSTASFSAERNEENPIFSSQEELGSYQLQRFLDKKKINTLFLRYSFSKTDLTRIVIPELVLHADQHVRLSTIAVNLTRDSRDNVLDAHKGFLQTLELDLNTTKLGSSVDFAKLTAQAAYYKEIFHNIVWANSVRVGLAQPFANSRVPLSEAFFTGGGNTLRGFPLDGAGPQRQVFVCPTGTSDCTTSIQVPSGGNELLLINSELRIPLPIRKGLGLAVFYDGGNVFPKVGFHDFTSLYSNNVGLGLRYATPVGPIRIDLGRNLNPIPGIQATQYFISIGQAF